MHGSHLALRGALPLLSGRRTCPKGGAQTLPDGTVLLVRSGALTVCVGACARACARAWLVQYGAFCIMGCCASIVQIVGTALLVSKSDGIEQLAISIEEADGGGLGEQ